MIVECHLCGKHSRLETAVTQTLVFWEPAEKVCELPNNRYVQTKTPVFVFGYCEILILGVDGPDEETA